MAGLRVIETQNQEVLNPRDLMALDAQQKAQEQKRQQAKQTQRLKDIEAVNNDLKTPFFRDQVSSHVDEYVENRYEVGDTEEKSQAEKTVFLNMMAGLREIENK